MDFDIKQLETEIGRQEQKLEDAEKEKCQLQRMRWMRRFGSLEILTAKEIFSGIRN